MADDEIAHLDWEATVPCQLGPDGRGHDETATVGFAFRCIDVGCQVSQGFAMCSRCALLARRWGLDCMGCGRCYRADSPDWSDAVVVSVLRST